MYLINNLPTSSSRRPKLVEGWRGVGVRPKTKAMNTNQKDPGCCTTETGCCGITDMGCC